jgi:cytosine/adenosine deaminase-related metal-dependent hydrolase
MKHIGLKTPLIMLVLIAVASCATQPATTAADQVLLGRLFDAEHGRIIESGVVLIHEGRVSCSGERLECAWRDEVPVEDYGDALILPGLIDLHVHARPHYVGAFLPSGVTTLRDANNTIGMIRTLRASPGAPRIYAAGPMLDGPDSRMKAWGPGAGAIGEAPLEELAPILVADAEQARQAVAALADAGMNWIKLYERLDPEVFAAAIDAAHAHGLRVMADIGTTMTGGLRGATVDIVEAGDSGVDTIEHLSGLALAYQRRGGVVFDDDIDGEILDDIAADIAASGMWAVPTVTIGIQFADPDALPWQDLPGADIFAKAFEGHWQPLLAWAEREHAAAQQARRLLFELLARLHAADVVIGAGSDVPAAPHTIPGGALHQELAGLVKAGLSPIEALQAATWNAGRILGTDDLGHLKAGARADILVVDGDPTLDIHHSRHIRAVWFEGGQVDREAALRAVEAAIAALMAELEGRDQE